MAGMMPNMLLHWAVLFLAVSSCVTAKSIGSKTQASAGPRAAEVSFSINGVLWKAYKSQGKLYFFNTVTEESTWTDPRKIAFHEETRVTAFVMFAVPFAATFLFACGYLGYLKVMHPDWLQPSRKRRRSSNSGTPVVANGSPKVLTPTNGKVNGKNGKINGRVYVNGKTHASSAASEASPTKSE